MANENCYKCKHRGTVAGSCHSSCKHPCYQGENGGANAEFNMLLAAIGIMPKSQNTIKVVAQEHGVRNGWFLHPVNFDPAWLVSCTGFEPLEQQSQPAKE